MLVLGSDRTVQGASTIARERGVSTFFVGVTLVAIGSSLPEIATAVYGAAYGQGSLVVGHVVGSATSQITLGIGVVALLAPLSATREEVTTYGVGSPTRNPLAAELGADVTISYKDDDVVEQVKSHVDGSGVDVTLEAAGSQASFQQAVEMTRKGGTVSLDGISKTRLMEIPVNDLVKEEIEYRGARAHANKAKPSAEMVRNGQTDVDSLITHTFDFEEFEEAWEYATTRKDGAIKVALTF